MGSGSQPIRLRMLRTMLSVSKRSQVKNDIFIAIPELNAGRSFGGKEGKQHDPLPSSTLLSRVI